MDVPKKIVVDFPDDGQRKGRAHAPAGYYDSDTDDDYNDDDSPPRIHVEPTTRLMSPPQKLTLHEISDEEKRRVIRDNSFSAGGNGVAFLADDSMYKTPNDTVLKNMNSFQSGDPVSLARQVRHLHNRVKLIEEELQTNQSRQFLLFGVLSVYFLYKGFRAICY